MAFKEIDGRSCELVQSYLPPQNPKTGRPMRFERSKPTFMAFVDLAGMGILWRVLK